MGKRELLNSMIEMSLLDAIAKSARILARFLVHLTLASHTNAPCARLLYALTNLYFTSWRRLPHLLADLRRRSKAAATRRPRLYTIIRHR